MALDIAKAVTSLRDLTAKFDAKIAATTPFWPRIAFRVDSKRYDEKYGWLGSMPTVREWLGERLFQELRAANYLLANKHWENSLLIKKTDIADDSLGIYGPVLEQLAVEAAYHPDQLVFETLVAGESTACFDAQFFFDTDHSWGDSGSQSNDLTYNATDHTAVTTAEFKAAYHAARAAMLGFKNDRGKPLIRPVIGSRSSMLLLVPPQLELVATEAMTSTLISNSDNIILDRPDVVSSPYLTDGTKFYLFYTGDVLKPFVFQAREPLSRQMKGMDDLEFKDVKFMTEARYNVGYAAWWNAVLTTFN